MAKPATATANNKGVKVASGDYYELKFKHGSFHDFETELTINREDQVEVVEPIGMATQDAIANGRLVLVRNPRKQDKE